MMRHLGSFCALLSLVSTGSATWAEDAPEAPTPARSYLAMFAEIGVAEYEEHPTIAPVDSEWSALQFSGGLRYSRDMSFGGRWGAGFSAWQTGRDVEKWTENGLPVQKNDLQIGGVDARLEAGWPISDPPPLSLVPWVGFGFRNFLFERSDFVVDGQPSALGKVDESYNLVYIYARAEFQQYWTEDSGLRLDLLGGWMVFAEADNDLVGEKIDGDGGYLVEGRVDWFWEVSETTELALGVHVDVQRIQGQSTSFVDKPGQRDARFFDVEWPDNDWSSVGLSLSWRQKL